MILAKIFKTLGIIFIVLALLLLWQRSNPKRLMFSSFFPSKVETLALKKSQPTRLIIRDSNIDLPIIPAKIKGQRWETTTQGVSWLIDSSLPGEEGNSVIYGHNWENLLGSLISVKPGYQIEIVYKDGSKKIFIVDRTAIVSPKNISVLKQSKDKKITLYTCVGIFDEKRFVVVASLRTNLKTSARYNVFRTPTPRLSGPLGDLLPTSPIGYDGRGKTHIFASISYRFIDFEITSISNL